jgi:hypothetical protein
MTDRAQVIIEELGLDGWNFAWEAKIAGVIRDLVGTIEGLEARLAAEEASVHKWSLSFRDEVKRRLMETVALEMDKRRLESRLAAEEAASKSLGLAESYAEIAAFIAQRTRRHCPSCASSTDAGNVCDAGENQTVDAPCARWSGR